jgi:WD40 repeat protein
LFVNRWIFCAALLVLAACASEATPQDAPPQRNPPTIEAPGWREAVEPITAENAANVALLGRLDQPETSSTLFEHTISPDATRLAALNNEEILAWDLLTGELVFRTARNDATRLFYSSDKTELYAVNPNGVVLILDAETGSTDNTLNGHNAYASVVAFDPENDRMALGGTDGTVKVWDMFERQSLITIDAHTAPITALAFSADGTQLATTSGDGAARVWDWQNGQQVDELDMEESLPQRLAFAPDGEQVSLGSEQGAQLWSLTDPAQTRPLAIEGGATQILMYAPNGEFLIGGSRTGGLTLWNPDNGVRLGALPEVRGNQISADFSPDSAMLITSALGDTVSLWNLAQATQQIARAELPVNVEQIYAAEWTDDGRLLLLFDATGPVYAWGIGETTGE